MLSVQPLIHYLSASPRTIVLIPHYPTRCMMPWALVLGLQLYLEKKGHKACVISPSGYPAYLAMDKRKTEGSCATRRIEKRFGGRLRGLTSSFWWILLRPIGLVHCGSSW